MDDKMKNFTREVESIKKNPMERENWKIKQSEIKNSIRGLNSHLDLAEQKIIKLKNKLIENIQTVVARRTKKMECTAKQGRKDRMVQKQYMKR